MTDVQKKYITEWAAIAFSGTQTLVSLANDEYTNLSDELNNGAAGAKALFSDFALSLGSAAFTGQDAAIELYIIPSRDGTNYPDWTGNIATDQQENNPYFVGSFVVAPDTAAQELFLRDVEIPPGKWKIGVRNRANIGLAASGNTVNYRLWTYGSA